ncbi:MAG: HAD-IIIA family hydrolase [Cytophagales bacterium]
MKYIILDRDGTLIEHIPYLSDENQVSLIPGAKSMIHILLNQGHFIFLHTNQSGISRGYFSIKEVERCNNKMFELLEIKKNDFKRICIAPDYPPEDDSYRKPSIKFGIEVMNKFKITQEQLFYIGDSITDLETAHNLNCNGIGIDYYKNNKLKNDLKNNNLNFPVYNSLEEVTETILK